MLHITDCYCLVMEGLLIFYRRRTWPAMSGHKVFFVSFRQNGIGALLPSMLCRAIQNEAEQCPCNQDRPLIRPDECGGQARHIQRQHQQAQQNSARPNKFPISNAVRAFHLRSFFSKYQKGNRNDKIRYDRSEAAGI